MGIEETVAQLRGEVLAAQRRHAGAEQRALQEETRAGTLREALQEEFGTASLAQAREKLAALVKEFEDEAAEVQRQLDLAGGS